LNLEQSAITKQTHAMGIAPLLTPTSLKQADFMHALATLHSDLFVVVAFRILPEELFGLARLGAINLHASLLPKYRGAAPIQRAIQAGETETGVTVFRIDRGIDTGNILCQKRVSIAPDETSAALAARLSNCGAEMMIKVLNDLERGEMQNLMQDPQQASLAPKLRKEEANINWQLTACQIFNQIRAFKPFPGTVARLNGKTLGIEWAIPLAERSENAPGTVARVSKEAFDVQCGDTLLRILEVKPEGKRSMSAQSYMNARKIIEGTKLG
jgi:methionyl-tRNA formyltransferase